MYPGNNPYALLDPKIRRAVEKEVNAKVAQKKKKVTQPPPPDPMPAHRQQLLTDAEKKLTDNGFVVRDNTYVCELNARVQWEQVEVGAHLTINCADLRDQVKAVQSTKRTARDVLRKTKYHVTVEEYNEIRNRKNPRWYSEGNQWSTDPESYFHDADVTIVQAAIDEANGIIATVRQ